MSEKEIIEYKEGDFITNGKVIIYLFIKLERNWTPQNNYGRKQAEYIRCKHYPKSDKNDPKGYYSGEQRLYVTPGDIPGIWLQKDGVLGSFRYIDKTLIDPKIIKHLTK